jgi:hypothetical protein
MIRDTERDVIVAQQIDDVVLIPARMTELEGVVSTWVKELQKFAYSTAILFKPWRQLKQYRTGLRTKKLKSRL